MVKNLEIRNFKSIKYLKLNCKRINLFIGKPNTGKSNILESVGLFSLPYGDLKDFVRFENMPDLFFDYNLEGELKIKADSNYFSIKFEKGIFKASLKEGKSEVQRFDIAYSGKGNVPHSLKPPYKFYRFSTIKDFPRKEVNFLLPARGENLVSILFTNKSLRKTLSDMFSEYGLRIVLKPQENKIELQKEFEDIIVSFPYSIVSDTLLRIAFYLSAMETNEKSTIMFEEPEAHSFPYYTKYLAERIALGKKNQYFISTHNPYFLLSILEKSKKEDIAVFLTYLKDYQTKVRALRKKEIEEILNSEIDLFFNQQIFQEDE